MNKKSIAILIAAAVIFAMSVINIAMAAGGAGTSSDPIVTKSYVDDLVKDLQAQIDKAGSASGSTAPASGAGTFVVVEVQAGQSVIGKEGTELVLRSGSATFIDNGAVGVSDLTAGADMMSPKAVTKNHLLLVPRDDGRGIKCSTHAYVMVKGGYTIE